MLRQIIRVARCLVALLLLAIVVVAATGPSGRETGVLVHRPGAADGYTLFAPIASTETYLIDMAGNVIHTFSGEAPAGNAVYLLDNGHLLRTESAGPGASRRFTAGGAGGRVVEIAPDGTVVWSYTYLSATHRQHHDVASLTNGNVLLIAWEVKTAEQAIGAGRDPALIADGELWPDTVIEVRPTPPAGGEIVWRWRVWDHLVQDIDPSLPNYGSPAQRPGRIDINYVERGSGADWNHTNSVCYNEALDQIILSVHAFSELWIIDHAITTAQAAGSAGDLLYRWGNPRAYRAGTEEDQVFFGQHDAQWIGDGLPDEGDLLAFNNGFRRPGATFSSVDQITPPLRGDGTYAAATAEGYLPDRLTWSYASAAIYSQNISGCQRLENGNTLICSGAEGRLFEVTPDGRTVWVYVHPFVVRDGDTARAEVFKARRYPADAPGIVALLAAISDAASP